MAVDNEDAAGQDQLSSLPRPVLLHIIALLPAASATCLGVACQELREVAFADEVWKPRCEAKQWAAAPGHAPFPFQRGFSARQRSACRECGRPSRYVFALLGVRLCEKCEHQVRRVESLGF